MKAQRGPGYLVGALAHSVDQLLDDHVHTLDAGLLQLYHLLLHYSFESHVWGEESGPDNEQKMVNSRSTPLKWFIFKLWLG